MSGFQLANKSRAEQPLLVVGDVINNADVAAQERDTSNAKRFKPSPPLNQRPVIDLTNDSDDFEEIISDTNDSSDEDDVMITAVRDLSRPNTAINGSGWNQLNSFNVAQSKPENSRLQSLTNVDHLNPLLPKAEPSFVQNGINHIQPQTTEQALINNNNNLNTGDQHPLKNRVVRINGITYKSETDVENREVLLKRLLGVARKQLSECQKEADDHAVLLARINASVDRLETLKVPESTREYNELKNSKAAFMAKVQEDSHARKIFDMKVKHASRELLDFTNQVKPKALSMIRNLRHEEQLAAQKRINDNLAKQRQQQFRAQQLQQQQQHNSIFGGMLNALNPLRHAFAMDDDDYDDYNDYNDEEELFNHMQRDTQNAYNTDAQDLRSFLESIKALEESQEGESNTPDDLTVNLLKHQRLGLHWLEINENDAKKRGGILADAMGLGKTVQAISVMLSRRSEDDECKTNLIVCPVALIRQWESELTTKVKESAQLTVCIYTKSGKGKSRIQTFKQLSKFDVVLVSYQTLASEMKKHVHGYDLGNMGIRRINVKKDANSYHSPFFSKDSIFYRIVLDEAHIIKNKLTKASLACSLLESTYRWCLSGTPMQNNIEEIFPLIRFLRIKPYCFEDRFRADIAIPLKSRTGNYDDYDKEDALKRVRVMLKAILLKRSKDSVIDGQPILTLPEKRVIKEDIVMADDRAEYSFYNNLEGRSANEVESMLEKGLSRGNYSSILTLLLRLRQACLHSELVRIGERKQGFTFDEDGNLNKRATWDMMYKYAQDLKPEVVRRINAAEAQDGEEGEKNRFECPVCMEPTPDNDWVLCFPCGHGLCKECVDKFFDEFQEAEIQGIKVSKCIQCRLQVKETQLITYPIFDKVCNQGLSKSVVGMIHDKDQKKLASVNKEISEEMKGVKLSPKLSKALELIKKIISENNTDKIILFSQFTTLFDIFQKFITQEHIEALRYDGSMTSDSRNNVIKEFYKNPNKKLLMISLKAGNVGLTLTCANHVIVMDPFWNPYVEEQAQDRAHRIGQQKPVTVYRLLVGGTVEDRIMELQNNKKLLVEGALDEQGIKNVSGLGRNEIEFLFNLRPNPRGA